MMSESVDLNDIQLFFKTRHIRLCCTWLQQCVKWLKEEQGISPQNDIYTEVYQQWLLLDLNDVQVPILPQNVNEATRMILSDRYSLQISSLMDISRPKMWQLNKIRNFNTHQMPQWQLDEAIGKGDRVLLITLTDGVQEIQAMEYKPIKQLNLIIAPGAKVQIIGPVTVRRGRIMLESKNIVILGGEVESLVISNSIENTLAKELNLTPPTDNTPIESDVYLRNGSIPHKVNEIPRNASITPFVNEQSKSDDIKPLVGKILTKENIMSISDEKIKSLNISQTQLPQSSGIFKPIFTLSKINKLKNEVTRGKFRVQAKFKSIINNLYLDDEAWGLEICIEDNTGTLNCEVHSNVISEIMEHTPQEAHSIKESVYSNLSAVRKLLDCNEHFEDKLKAINCIMDIFLEKNKSPCIVRLNV